MSRRDQIRMTDEEVEEFLAGTHTMSVATIGPDGRPHLVAMWYGFHPSGDLAFWTYGKSQKIANLRRDPRLTCMVETGSTYEELRGVELVATGEILEDREEVLAVGLSTMSRHTGIADRSVAEVVGAKRVAVRLHIDRIVSWDHRKLGGTY